MSERESKISHLFAKHFSINVVDESHYTPKLLTENHPFLIRTNHAEHPLLTPEKINHLYGNEIVNVGIFDRSKDRNFPQDRPPIRLSDAINLFYHHTDPNIKYYMMEQEINQDFPELLKELAPLRTLFPMNREIVFKLWFGEKDNVSPLHYDAMHNLLYQAYGCKQIILFSPRDTPYLYPSVDMKRFNYTTIDSFEYLDGERFPLAPKATPCVITLKPGDVLFIPSGWWHHALSLDLSITVPCWWIPRIDEAPLSHIFRLKAWESYHKGITYKIAEFVDLSTYRNSLEIAQAFFKLKYYWLTQLYLCDFVTENLIDLGQYKTIWEKSVSIGEKENDELMNAEVLEILINFLTAAHQSAGLATK